MAGRAVSGEAHAVAELEALAGEAPGAEPSRQPPPADTGPDTGDVIAALIGPLFGVLAPAWSVTDGEVTELGRAWGPVVDKYWPGGLSAFGCELNAALITLAVVGPRLRLPRQVQPAESAEGAADAAE